MKLLSTEVDKLIREIFNYKHPLLGELILNWGKIVGAKFSKYSYPLKVVNYKRRGKRNAVLYIRVDNSSICMEMGYHKGIILERIAIYLGYKGIHRVILEVS